MDISLDDLKQILTEGRLRVDLKGATCIHCNLVLPTVDAAEAHDAVCEKHPLQAELAELRAAFEAAKAERDKLYAAMREVCAIVGGQTADGVSVEFLADIPQSVRVTVAELERELAEARRDGERLEVIAKKASATRYEMTIPIPERVYKMLPTLYWTVRDIRAAIDAMKEG